MRRLAVVLATLAVPPLAQAAEQQHVLESPRALGRGDTFVAAFDSDEASRGNPATMADTPIKFQVRWLQVDLLIGDNSLTSINEVSKVDQQASATSLLKTFQDKFGKRQYGRVQVVPVAMRIGNFELMPFATTSNFIDMRDPTLPEVRFESDSMVGMSLSYALALSKEFSLGLTLRPAERTTFDGDVQFSDLLTFVNSSSTKLTDLFHQRQGMQLGADVGVIWKPTPNWRYGLLVENVGYAGGIGSASSPPNPYPQSVDLGLTYRVDWKPWHWDSFFDVQDLVNPNHYNIFRLLHAGTEIGRSYISRDNDIGLEAGINEGYFTVATYLDLFIARLNLSYYAVELGEYPGQRKDRRWGITLLSSMTF